VQRPFDMLFFHCSAYNFFCVSFLSRYENGIESKFNLILFRFHSGFCLERHSVFECLRVISVWRFFGVISGEIGIRHFCATGTSPRDNVSFVLVNSAFNQTKLSSSYTRAVLRQNNEFGAKSSVGWKTLKIDKIFAKFVDFLR
jgi:hypothetical protein